MNVAIFDHRVVSDPSQTTLSAFEIAASALCPHRVKTHDNNIASIIAASRETLLVLVHSTSTLGLRVSDWITHADAHRKMWVIFVSTDINDETEKEKKWFKPKDSLRDLAKVSPANLVAFRNSIEDGCPKWNLLEVPEEKEFEIERVTAYLQLTHSDASARSGWHTAMAGYPVDYGEDTQYLNRGKVLARWRCPFKIECDGYTVRHKWAHRLHNYFLYADDTLHPNWKSHLEFLPPDGQGWNTLPDSVALGFSPMALVDRVDIPFLARLKPEEKDTLKAVLHMVYEEYFPAENLKKELVDALMLMQEAVAPNRAVKRKVLTASLALDSALRALPCGVVFP